MIDETLLRLVRHNTWANLQLLAFCARLPEEQLAWTTPGVYGTVQATLQHTISAEHGYLFSLTGEMPPGGMPTAGTALPLADLTARAASNGERLERVLGGAFEPERVITRRNGKATAAIIVAQYIHHGSDHRAHVGTILGAHGVEPLLDAQGNGFDLWGFGRTTGEVTSA